MEKTADRLAGIEPVEGFFDECERLVGALGIRRRARETPRPSPIFGGFQARLDFRQSSGSAFQFFFGAAAW